MALAGAGEGRSNRSLRGKTISRGYAPGDGSYKAQLWCILCGGVWKRWIRRTVAREMGS